MKQGPTYHQIQYNDLMRKALKEAIAQQSIEPINRLLDENANVQYDRWVNTGVKEIFLFIAELADKNDITPLFEELLKDARITPVLNENIGFLLTAARMGRIKTIETLVKHPGLNQEIANIVFYAALVRDNTKMVNIIFQNISINPFSLNSKDSMMKAAVLNYYQEIIYELCSKFPEQLEILKQIDSNVHEKFVQDCYQKDFDLYSKLYQIGKEFALPCEIPQYAFHLHSICVNTPQYMPDYLSISSKKRKNPYSNKDNEYEPICKRLRSSKK